MLTPQLKGRLETVFRLSTVSREGPQFTLPSISTTSLPYLPLSLCSLSHVFFGFCSVFPAKGWKQQSTKPVHYTACQGETECLTAQVFTTAQRTDAIGRVKEGQTIYFLQPTGTLVYSLPVGHA